jgi:hypothetical protein
MTYDYDDLEELELALDQMGFTLDDLPYFFGLESIEAGLDRVRELMDELGLSDYEDLVGLF